VFAGLHQQFIPVDSQQKDFRKKAGRKEGRKAGGRAGRQAGWKGECTLHICTLVLVSAIMVPKGSAVSSAYYVMIKGWRAVRVHHDWKLIM
jgi:hypothetical protein